MFLHLSMGGGGCLPLVQGGVCFWSGGLICLWARDVYNLLPGKHLPPTRQTPSARQTLPPDRHPRQTPPTYWNAFLFLNVFTKQALRVTHHHKVVRTPTGHPHPTRFAVLIFSVVPKMKYYLHSALNRGPLPFLLYGYSTELI